MRRNVLALLALCVVLFFDILFLGRGFYKGDLYNYQFPMKKLVRELTFADGIPQWNPAYHAGQPLAANPAYELFYPGQWPIYLGSFAFAFQLHILLHIAVAAIGMYFFLRSLDVGETASMVGAAAFAFGGPFLSHLIRLPILFAMTWLPLVLMFARKIVLTAPHPASLRSATLSRERERADARSASGEGLWRPLALGAICFGMQALIGEPITVLQTGAIAGVYALIVNWKSLPRLALMFALGLLIAAVHLVPGADHARDSVRSEGFTWQVASNWSTPPRRLAELAYPQLWRALPDANGEQRIRTMYDFRIEPFISDIYLGLLILVGAIAGVLRGVRGRWYVLAAVVVSALMAFGQYGPFFRFLHDHRLIPSVRYPEKFLVAGLFMLIAWGAFVLDRVASDAKLRRIAVGVTVAWLVIGAIVWMSRLGIATPAPALEEARALSWHGYWALNLARGAIALALLRKFWMPGLVLFAALDGVFITNAARISRTHFEPPAAARLTGRDGRLFHKAAWDEWEGNPIAYEHFAKAKQTNLVLREAMFPFVPAAYGYRMALEDDLDQTRLMTSTEFTRAAMDVKSRTGTWHPWFLHAAGIRYVAEFLPSPAAPPIHISDLGPAPRFWFARRLIPLNDRAEVVQYIVTRGVDIGDAFIAPPAFTPATGRVLRAKENRIEVESTGDAILVASITHHKYWRATIDGNRTQPIVANLGFIGVAVPQGRHVVELTYRNPLIVPSLIVSVLALVACVILPRR